MSEGISEKCTIPSKFVDVYGAKMHYLEAGAGNPILFLHGIPMSSYSWRNVIPHLTTLGKCIAPDLIGFGQSEKPDIDYTIEDHIKYIDKFIETLGLKNLTIIMHGWGSVIGFDYAMRNEKKCNGLVFYEAFLRSINGDDISLPYQEQLIALQSEEHLADIISNGSSFIDRVIPQHVMRQLTNTEMNHYRQPFTQKGSAKPLAQYIKELPVGHGNSKADQIINGYTKKLIKSSLPKLLLYSVPGFITTIATVMWAKENLSHLEIVDVGEELHLAQESYPQLMGDTISVWMQGIEAVHT